MNQSAHKTTLGKVKRLLEIIDLLRLRERTPHELVKALGRSRSTIHRDLRDLESLEIGLKHAEDGGKYAIPPSPSSLNDVEALATHAAVRLMYHHAPSVNRHFERVLEKLAAQLPEHIREIARQSTKNLRERRPARHGDDRTLEIVARAWATQRVLRFTFVKPGGSGQARINELEVYFIEVSRANLATYVIGRERAYHDAVRTFKLSRIGNPQLLVDGYEIPDDFDPTEYLSDAWGVTGKSDGVSVTVRLRFAPEARYRIEEGGFPNVRSQRDLPVGSLEVEITAGTDSTGFPRELLPWIQSWGPRVEVIEPQHLRERWLEEARAVIKRYAELDMPAVEKIFGGQP
jgi:predicted DNA-binding transcriptional regulator YafY